MTEIVAVVEGLIRINANVSAIFAPVVDDFLDNTDLKTHQMVRVHPQQALKNGDYMNVST